MGWTETEDGCFDLTRYPRRGERSNAVADSASTSN